MMSMSPHWASKGIPASLVRCQAASMLVRLTGRKKHEFQGDVCTCYVPKKTCSVNFAPVISPSTEVEAKSPIWRNVVAANCFCILGDNLVDDDGGNVKQSV